MVKDVDPHDFKNLKMTVKLKDGTMFIGKDFPTQFLGEHSNIVSFWFDEKVLCITPMSEVEYISLW